MSNITLATKETIANEYFINKFIQIAHPILMIGLACWGKTHLAKGILRDIVKGREDSFVFQQINFNYYTDASYMQIELEQTLEKKAGKQFGPPGKVKLIYFIDDLNMPQLDQYDTQSAISLLHYWQLRSAHQCHLFKCAHETRAYASELRPAV
jgi:dynein heavy chain